MGTILFRVIIEPLKLLMELIYAVALEMIGSKGYSIVALSLAVNFLILPLYLRSDAMQEEERRQQERLAFWTGHIRRGFRGDERSMMLSEYYRQNGYHPAQALRGSLSLFLQIPFFLAAYDFLSHLTLLKGASFHQIRDLGAPDALLSIGGLAINLLPILMTAINLASGVVYLRGYPLKNKLQVYGMAGIFLIVLYGSPSGLVLYWTMNNLFSLGKNLFIKHVRDKRRGLALLFAGMGVSFFGYMLLRGKLYTAEIRIFAAAVLAVSLLPLAVLCYKRMRTMIQARGLRSQEGISGAQVPREGTGDGPRGEGQVSQALLVAASSSTGSDGSRGDRQDSQALLVAGPSSTGSDGPRGERQASRAAVEGRRSGGSGRVPRASRLAILALLGLTLLLGSAIPLSVLSSAPADFVGEGVRPFGLWGQTLLVYIGIFLVWGPVVWSLLPERHRGRMAILATAALFLGLADHLFFGKDLGILYTTAVYEVKRSYTAGELAVNAVVALAILGGVFLWGRSALRKQGRLGVHLPATRSGAGASADRVTEQLQGLIFLAATACAALAALSLYYAAEMVRILEREGATAKTDGAEVSKAPSELPALKLSRRGRNVVVIMLDRAINGYVPAIMEESPKLREQFDGFVYYPNTLSFAENTRYGSPPIFGGYEYTPSEMNRRDQQRLVDKHNEALRLMPELFWREGHDVTVVNPPYSNYSTNGDYSIYDSYEGVRAYDLERMLPVLHPEIVEAYQKRNTDTRERNFVCYSVFRCAPLFLQDWIYDKGQYHSAAQFVDFNPPLAEFYAALESFQYLTDYTEEPEGAFLMADNNLTHAPQELQLPDYTFSMEVDNGPWREDWYGQFEGRLHMDNQESVGHYHVNAAALRLLGQWFDQLRAEGVYDSTRIILVADHGFSLRQFDGMLLSNGIDVQRYNPLLMVKDFGASSFSTSEEFMTTADVPSLAMADVIEDPTNPFTGRPVDQSEKSAHPQLVTTSERFTVTRDESTVFDVSDGTWYAVDEDIFDERNWVRQDGP